MRINYILLFVLTSFLCAGCGRNTPDVVTAGLETYKTNSLKAAYGVWATDGPLAADLSSRDTFLSGLDRVQAVYGKPTGYEILKVVRLSSSVRRVYAVINCEKGPIYGSFDCYQRDDGKWCVTDLVFHTKANAVFPPSLLDG